MRKHPVNALGRGLGPVILLALILTLGHNVFSVYGDPGPEWVNIFSGDATLYGKPVPVGAVITAHDPQGVQCGDFVVHTEGKFGLLDCRRDDPTTAEDEGPEPGERISFRVNGLPATAVPLTLNGTPVDPSTPITWSGFGDRWKVRLRAPTPVGGYSLPARWMAMSWARRTVLPLAGLAVTALVLAAVALTKRRRTEAPGRVS